MTSQASTVDEYIAELPPDRQAAISSVRAVILENLPQGYEEGMQYGLIGYHVPHHVFPQGYHCDPKQPLPFAGMASQKNYMSVYLYTVYGHEGEEQWFREAYAAAGKKLDMGNSCIRFKKLDDLALDVIGQAIARTSVDNYIAGYLKALGEMKSAKSK